MAAVLIEIATSKAEAAGHKNQQIGWWSLICLVDSPTAASALAEAIPLWQRLCPPHTLCYLFGEANPSTSCMCTPGSMHATGIDPGSGGEAAHSATGLLLAAHPAGHLAHVSKH